MIIEAELSISQSAFFAVITKSILNDIEQSTGAKLLAEDLPHYEYQKNMNTKMGMNHHCTVKIKEFVVPTLYEASITASQGMNSMRYEVEKVSENSCFVRYSEDFISTSSFNNWNYKIMSLFYIRSSRKRMLANLRYIEQQVLAGNEL